MAGYTLRAYSGLLSGQAWIGDITRAAGRWQRTVRGNGGAWQGSFALMAPMAELQRWFYEGLGWHVEERSRGGTLEFMVYEMELTVDGVTRRRSLDQIQQGMPWANAIKTLYVNEDNEAQETDWAVDSASVARYGRKEEMLTLDNVSATVAEAERDTALRERAWPRAMPAPVAVGERQRADGLSVTVVGYIFTGNWRYVTVQDAAAGNVSVYISDIISTDCEFLSVGSITANTLQVLRETGMPQRAWDTVKKLVELGDVDHNPWRLTVDTGRRARYGPVDTAARYWLRRGGLYSGPGERMALSEWTVRPAVVRDALYPVRRSEPGTPFLSDVRDFYADEVEVGAGSGLTLKPLGFGEGELMAAYREYEAWMGQRLEERGR